jgi:hypothetical protein
MTRFTTLLGVAAAAVTWLVVAPHASAAPNGCSDVRDHRSYSVACGPDFRLNYQAWADCKDDIFPWNEHHVLGSWEHPHEPSTASQASCGAWGAVQRSGIDTR